MWRKKLPNGVDVCPIQLPGRENRLSESPFTDIRRLIERLVKVLGPYMDLPFALFGHSLGALVSFELCRALRKQQLENPAIMFVSCIRAPQCPKPTPIHHLPDHEFIKTLTERYQAMPAAVLENEELIQLYLPALKADFTLLDTYQYVPEAPLDFPISAFGGLKDNAFNRDDIKAWAHQTSHAFKIRMLPGGHLLLNENPELVLQSVSDDLLEIFTDHLTY